MESVLLMIITFLVVTTFYIIISELQKLQTRVGKLEVKQAGHNPIKRKSHNKLKMVSRG